MPRRRFQTGSLRVIGNQYVLSFYEDQMRDGRVRHVRVSKRIGGVELSEREINRRKQEILNRVNNQTEIPVREMKNGMTFAEYIPEFRHVGMIDLKPSTRRSLESSIRAHLIPIFGEVQLSKIDAKAAQEVINSMLGNARGSRENVIDDLLMILDEARKGHVIPAISKKDLKFGLKKPGEGRAFVFSTAQVNAILKAFAGRKPWGAFFWLLAHSGLRSSEILGLRVEDLDFDNNVIHVRQGVWHGQVVTLKTEESENTVPMTAGMKARLQELLVNHSHELVFVNRRGRPYSRNKVVQKVLHPVLDKLKISRKGRRVGLHAFRHHLASRLLQTTGVAVAQRQLRHSDPNTTLGHYGHILGNDHREAMDAIEAATESVFVGK